MKLRRSKRTKGADFDSECSKHFGFEAFKGFWV